MASEGGGDAGKGMQTWTPALLSKLALVPTSRHDVVDWTRKLGNHGLAAQDVSYANAKVPLDVTCPNVTDPPLGKSFSMLVPVGTSRHWLKMPDGGVAWPKALLPQHTTPPSVARIAQEW
jgi:hypothetical protein